MPVPQTGSGNPMQTAADDIPAMSDDECLIRLARAIDARDLDHLDEVARLIGRLAVTIE
jgi:hypothetical protein